MGSPNNFKSGALHNRRPSLRRSEPSDRRRSGYAYTELVINSLGLSCTDFDRKRA